MSIDPSVEEIFPVRGLRQRAGVKRSKYSLKRWWRDGVISPVTGERVKLEMIYEGNVACTSVQAYYRFLFRMNGQEIPAHLESLLKESVVKKPPKPAKKAPPVKGSPHEKMESKKKEAKEKRC